MDVSSFHGYSIPRGGGLTKRLFRGKISRMDFLVYISFFITLYFVMFMVTSFVAAHELPAEQRTPRRAIAPELLPSVSIIVPCYNEEQTLAATMESLLALDYPQEKLHIIIVNDGSKDRTIDVARSYASDARVRVIDKANGGKFTAMNAALPSIDTDLVGCLDADSVVDSGALQVIAPVFVRNADVQAVTPGILIKKPETLIQHMQDAEYRLSIFNRFTLAALGSAFITPGPFSIYRTPIVKELGGWRHAHATEDLEMALRIQEAGGLIANAPTARVYTGSPRTLHALYKQRVRWTYGFLRNAIDYRHMFGNGAFGNLSLVILPSALVSIFIAVFFAFRVVYYMLYNLWHEFIKISLVGIEWYMPGFDPFYVNSSMLMLLAAFSIVVVLVLIAVGTGLIHGHRRLPVGIVPFVLLYCFIAPLWLTTAVIRAIFKTGVQWDVNRSI